METDLNNSGIVINKFIYNLGVCVLHVSLNYPVGYTIFRKVYSLPTPLPKFKSQLVDDEFLSPVASADTALQIANCEELQKLLVLVALRTTRITQQQDDNELRGSRRPPVVAL